MAKIGCYSGPDPLDNEKARIRIWKWAKANGIDKGLPFDKIAEAINQHFYDGMARPQWIAAHLEARKTPFREISNALWRAQANRRAIVEQAKGESRYYQMGSLRRVLSTIYNLPRAGLVFAHGTAFPAVHAGRLTMQPLRWGMYLKSIADSWRSLPLPGIRGDIYHERLMNPIRTDPLYDLYTRGGLDMKSIVQSQPEYISRIPGLGPAAEWSHKAGTRGWDALLALRFALMDAQMKRYMKPGMSNAELLELAKELAPGVNHATGSAKIPLPPKYAGVPGQVFFGPKLLAAKLASLTTDPLKAASTAAKIVTGKSTYAERAGLYAALSGSAQWVGGTLATLALNAAFNQRFNPTQKVNVIDDPTKSDWLKYKVGGMEFEAPGLLPEIREIGKQIAIQMMDPKAIKAHNFYSGGQKQTTKAGAMWAAFWDSWLQYKLHPAISEATAITQGLTGQNVPPWYADNNKKMDWWKFALSQGLPMSFSGAAGYFYDSLRKGDLSHDQALNIIQGAVMLGLGLHGIPVRQEPPPKPPKPGVRR